MTYLATMWLEQGKTLLGYEDCGFNSRLHPIHLNSAGVERVIQAILDAEVAGD